MDSTPLTSERASKVIKIFLCSYIRSYNAIKEEYIKQMEDNALRVIKRFLRKMGRHRSTQRHSHVRERRPMEDIMVEELNERMRTLIN